MTDDQDNPTPRCRMALNTVARVRQEMCAIYRLSRSGELPLGDMTRLIFALSQIGKLLEVETFEARLTALEALPDAAPQRLPQLEDLP